MSIQPQLLEQLDRILIHSTGLQMKLKDGE